MWSAELAMANSKPMQKRIEKGNGAGGSASQERAVQALKLIKRMVVSTTALAHISAATDDPFKVLISTILSARTRDPVTEAASARLFDKFPDPASLARASEAAVEKLIKPVTFYRIKAPRIIEVARVIEQKYGGVVPDRIEDLLELPGVGRKTANCVLVYGFKLPAVPVDVHVHRISNRIGLVKTKTPEETETELSKIYPRKYWLDVNENFVAFGQTICRPGVPKCYVCDLRPICDYYRSVVSKTKTARAKSVRSVPAAAVGRPSSPSGRSVFR